MMRPVERAAAVYEAEPCARTFREDLEAHLLNGFVFNTPESFVMARPVVVAADARRIVDPWVEFDPKAADGWFIYLFAGDIRPALKWFPYKLKWIGFERRNQLRWYGFQSALAKLKGLR